MISVGRETFLSVSCSLADIIISDVSKPGVSDTFYSKFSDLIQTRMRPRMQCKYAGLTYISDVITETGFDISKVERSTLCNNLQIFNSPIILKYN